jgi:hypothetical protein
MTTTSAAAPGEEALRGAVAATAAQPRASRAVRSSLRDRVLKARTKKKAKSVLEAGRRPAAAATGIHPSVAQFNKQAIGYSVAQFVC